MYYTKIVVLLLVCVGVCVAAVDVDDVGGDPDCPTYEVPNINPDTSAWRQLKANYSNDYVFQNLCGFMKVPFFQCMPVSPQPNISNIPAAIRPPAGNRTVVFQTYLQGVRAYGCNTSVVGGYVQLDSRSCLFQISDTGVKSYKASAAFIRAPGTANVAFIGTLVAPISAIQIQQVGTVPTPTGDPTLDLPWELTRALDHFRNERRRPPTGLDFTNVNYINRINTRGGQLPPASSCTSDVDGKRIELVYSANYIFYGSDTA